MANHDTSQTSLQIKVFRSGVWVAIGTYSNIIVGFIANLILTRILAPEQFGLFAYSSFFFSLLNLRYRIPVGYGFIQKKDTSGDLIGSLLVTNLAASLGSLLLLGLLIPVLQLTGRNWEVLLIIFGLINIGVIDSFSGTAQAILDKDLQFGKSSIVSGIAFPISYLPAILLAFNNYGAWSLLCQNAVYSILFFIGITIMSKRQVPQMWSLTWRFDWTTANYLIKFGTTVGLSSISSMLLGQFDNFLVGSFVGINALGFYDRAYRLAQWPATLVTGVINKIAIYIYSRLQHDAARLKKSAEMSFWVITTLGLPLAISIFVAAPDLVILLYTERWLPSSVYLKYLVVLSIIQPLMGNAGELFIGIGKPKINIIITGVQAISLIIIGTILTINFGVIGTCIAVGITFFIGMIFTYYYIHRFTPIRIWKVWVIPGIVAIITVLINLALHNIIPLNEFSLVIKVMIKITLATGTYLIIIFLMNPKDMIQKIRYIIRLVFVK